MSRRRMVVTWVAGSVILVVLFTARLGVFGRLSIVEHAVLFAGALLVTAMAMLLSRLIRRLSSK